MPPAAEQLLIALGGNLPFEGQSQVEMIPLAIAGLGQMGLTGLRLSRLFRTPCFPAGAGPDYVNAAAAGPVPEGWDAPRILHALHAVEDRFGRRRESRWGMRTLDLDLVAVGGQILPDAATQNDWRALPPDRQVRETPDRLILPHPRMQDRGFVLVPLADVAPDWRHPLTGLTVAQMLAMLPPDACRDILPVGG